MGLRTDSLQELARKALWAEVYDHAAELLARLAEDTHDDPVEAYNALFLSAYLFRLLGNPERSAFFASKFTSLNDEVSKHIERATATKLRFPDVKNRVGHLVKASGGKMSPAEVISFFVSPFAYASRLKKMLKADSKAPPTFQAGIFRYSVTARLESIMVRGYSEGPLDLARLSNASELTLISRTKLGAMVALTTGTKGIFLIDEMGVLTGDYQLIEITDHELSIILDHVKILSKIFSERSS